MFFLVHQCHISVQFQIPQLSILHMFLKSFFSIKHNFLFTICMSIVTYTCFIYVFTLLLLSSQLFCIIPHILFFHFTLLNCSGHIVLYWHILFLFHTHLPCSFQFLYIFMHFTVMFFSSSVTYILVPQHTCTFHICHFCFSAHFFSTFHFVTHILVPQHTCTFRICHFCFHHISFSHFSFVTYILVPQHTCTFHICHFFVPCFLFILQFITCMNISHIHHFSSFISIHFESFIHWETFCVMLHK